MELSSNYGVEEVLSGNHYMNKWQLHLHGDQAYVFREYFHEEFRGQNDATQDSLYRVVLNIVV